MSKIKSLLKLAVLSSTLTLFNQSVLAESKWDGKYNASFPFQMSRASVCPISASFWCWWMCWWICPLSLKNKSYIFQYLPMYFESEFHPLRLIIFL